DRGHGSHARRRTAPAQAGAAGLRARSPLRLGIGGRSAPGRLPRGARRGGGAVKLTVLCPHFEPDVAPTGEVMTRIAHELVARGHRLHVVTALPWYRHHDVEPGWEGSILRHERRSWGSVTRVHP